MKYPDDLLYRFDDHLLQYMVQQCSGEFPPEMLLSEGIRKLLEHDRQTQVSYIETLRVYLDNNMNLSKASAAMYIHKSSFLARITKIREILGMDLDDPEGRLLVNIMLRQISYGRVGELSH